MYDASVSVQRVALHQSRLVAPGLRVDDRGIVIGPRALVLLASIERLVMWLRALSKERGLAELGQGAELWRMRATGAPDEVGVIVPAESSDRTDRLADLARLVGGEAFTGESRHYVPWRDAHAAFGYDAVAISSLVGDALVYREHGVQAYEKIAMFDLGKLLLRLEPHPNPTAGTATRERIITTEGRLGWTLASYFARSGVEAKVGEIRWNASAHASEPGPEGHLFFVPELPARMDRLVCTTPGIHAFSPVATGVAVELGFEHPVELDGAGVFPDDGLVLFRGRQEPPFCLPALPTLADVRALLVPRIAADSIAVELGRPRECASAISLPLVLERARSDSKLPTATFVPRANWPLLRRLLYALSGDTVSHARAAVGEDGVFVVLDGTVDALPLGRFFCAIGEEVYVPAGATVSPALGASAIRRALDTPTGASLILDWPASDAPSSPGDAPRARATTIARDAFLPLGDLLSLELDASEWSSQRPDTERLDAELSLELGSIGPMFSWHADLPDRPLQLGPPSDTDTSSDGEPQ